MALNRQLLYDALPGEHVSDAAEAVVKWGLGGMVFNDLIIRAKIDDTVETLVGRYCIAIQERQLNRDLGQGKPYPYNRVRVPPQCP